MKFRPCIDLHKGKVKQIVGSTLRDHGAEPVENFVSDKDAAYYARLYRRDGLTGGHTIMLGPGNESEALKAVRAYPGGLQVGGGITADNAERYLAAGASHVIVTSYVFHAGKLQQENLARIAAVVGAERLVLDLSCRRVDDTYYVMTDRWQQFTEFSICADNLCFLSRYCSEFLVHAVDVEGQCRGVEKPLVEQLAAVSPLPLTYAGGITSFADLEMIKQLGQGRVDATVGSALDLFGGPLPYREVVRRYAS